MCRIFLVVAVGDMSHDMVADRVVVDSPVVGLCQVAPVVVATPIAVVSCGKRKLPAKRSPAPVVRFFDPKSSAAKEEHLQLLESRRKILEERIEEISVYIEEGKNDLKYVSNFSFAGEDGYFSPVGCTDLIQGRITSSIKERAELRATLTTIKNGIKSWLKTKTNAKADRLDACAREEEEERKGNERKQKDRSRHLHGNMSPEQVAADNARHLHANMSPEQVAAHVARNLHANM